MEKEEQVPSLMAQAMTGFKAVVATPEEVAASHGETLQGGDREEKPEGSVEDKPEVKDQEEPMQQ